MRKAAWFVLLLVAGALGAESLWDPDSTGYYTGRHRLQEGDFLRVVLTGEGSLSFVATKATDKSVTLDFSAGSPVASALSPGKISDADKTQASSDYKIKNFRLTVRVVSVDSHGIAKIEGHRSVAMGGGQETLDIVGTIDSRDVKGRDIDWADVADLVLTYQNASESARNVLSPQDFAPDGKSLLPDKQKELLRQYLNRMLDTFFAAAKPSS